MTISITGDQLTKAFEAIGAVYWQIAYPKEYAQMIDRCTQDIADNIDSEVLEQILREQKEKTL